MKDCMETFTLFVFYRSFLPPHHQFINQKNSQAKNPHQNRVGQETDAKFFQKLPFSLQNDQLNRFPASTLSS